MNKVARNIIPDNVGLNEIQHDGTLAGKGTSGSKLRVTAARSYTDSSIFGDGTASQPYTTYSENDILLSEDGTGLLTEDGEYILVESAVIPGFKNIINISASDISELTNNAIYVIDSTSVSNIDLPTQDSAVGTTVTFLNIIDDLPVYFVLDNGIGDSVAYRRHSDDAFTNTPYPIINQGGVLTMTKVAATQWIATTYLYIDED